MLKEAKRFTPGRLPALAAALLGVIRTDRLADVLVAECNPCSDFAGVACGGLDVQVVASVRLPHVFNQIKGGRCKEIMVECIHGEAPGELDRSWVEALWAAARVAVAPRKSFKRSFTAPPLT